MHKQDVKENLRKWVTALRSHQYLQGKSALRTDGRYCCLGVACDISPEGHWLGNAYVLDNDSVRDASLIWMPGTLGMDRFGLSQTDQHSLSNMNDEGQTFLQIADYIEREFIGR